jgi:DNA-binding beta-propeller fold protein YncE
VAERDAGKFGNHGRKMAAPRRVPPAALAAGLLLVALVAVGRVTAGSLPPAATREPATPTVRSTTRTLAASPVVAEIAMAGIPLQLAFGAGSLWVSNTNGTVSRVDPATNRVVAIIQLPRSGRQARAIAVGAGAVWVAATAGMVWRIDPVGNRVVGKVDTGSSLYEPIGVAAQDDAVWLVCCANAAPGRYRDSKLLRIDPARNRVVARIAVIGDPLAVVADERAVWIATMQGRAEQIDRATNRVMAVIPAGGPIGGAQAMAIGHGGVWLADPGNSTVLRIDPATARTVARIPVAAATRVAVDDAGVWVVQGYEGALALIHPGADRPAVAISTRHLRDVRGLAVGAGSVWAASGTTIARIDPARVR